MIWELRVLVGACGLPMGTQFWDARQFLWKWVDTVQMLQIVDTVQMLHIVDMLQMLQML